MTQDQKDEELYKASLEAFFNNELEADKTILGLSVAAIGFFMALFLNKDFQITEIMFITIIIALISFLAVSSMIMLIFIRNKKQILHIIETTGGLKEDLFLDFLDKWKYLPFIIGIICSIIFTLSLIYGKISTKETPMAKEKIERPSPKVERVISKAQENNSSAGISGLQEANKTPPPPTDSNKSGETDGK
ncbi:MAG: hypothetical protein AB1763_09305 [Campylobacterota bacterium]